MSLLNKGGWSPHAFAAGDDGYCVVCENDENIPDHLVTDREVATAYGRRAPETPTEIIAAESDPDGIGQHTPGAKLDAGKLRPWLCIAGFSNALRAVADVTTKGAVKYTPGGWQHVENGEERYMDAFGRHLLSLGGGETVDLDTGCYHKAQMIWNLLASLELELRLQNSCIK